MGYRREIIIGTLWLIADLWTKAWAQQILTTPRILIPGWLSLTLQKNSGIAFGIPIPTTLAIIASILLIGGLLYLNRSYKNRFLIQPIFGIILGGAVGNLINRLTLGYVVDWIALWPIPTFNLADMGITLGLISLALMSFQKKTNIQKT